MNVIFNIKRVKMGCVISMSTQHDSFIKCVKWVKSCQPTSITGEVKVERSWHDY